MKRRLKKSKKLKLKNENSFKIFLKNVMLIKVKVSPNSKKEEIIEKLKNSFNIKVKEKPIQGKANKAVINVLSLYYKIPKDKIKIVKGLKSRNKIFEVIN